MRRQTATLATLATTTTLSIVEHIIWALNAQSDADDDGDDDNWMFCLWSFHFTSVYKMLGALYEMTGIHTMYLVRVGRAHRHNCTWTEIHTNPHTRANFSSEMGAGPLSLIINEQRAFVVDGVLLCACEWSRRRLTRERVVCWKWEEQKAENQYLS